MEDESLFTKNQPKVISESLQNFIDSLVEEIVLQGKPFDTQKKYLKKYSENEGIDYDKLEGDISAFIEILDSLKTTYSQLQVKLAVEKGRECHISEDTVKKLVSYSSPKNPQSSQNHTWLKIALTISSLLMISFLILYLGAKKEVDSMVNKQNNIKDELRDKKEELTKYEDRITKLKDSLSTLKSDIALYAPFVIYNVEIANTESDGTIETDYGKTIYSSNTMYLKPKLHYIGFKEGTYNLKIKWYRADGSLALGSSSPSGFSQEGTYSLETGRNWITTSNWGNATKGHWKQGDLRLEIWYENKCVFVKLFKVY